VTFAEFEKRALSDWDRIPAEFKRGVDGIMVRPDVVTHPELDDVFTMGECITESYPSSFGSDETTRSLVVLYYGSFREMARGADLDPFDWEDEIWETITHELQHHLESLAGDDALGDMDYAADQNFKRYEGDPFDPFFYRAGEDLGDATYRVEEEYFIEVPLPARSVSVDSSVAVRLGDRQFRVSVPAIGEADVAYIAVVDDERSIGAPVTIVMVREVRGLRAIGALLMPRRPKISLLEGTIE
jgi:hypothetical protein